MGSDYGDKTLSGLTVGVGMPSGGNVHIMWAFRTFGLDWPVSIDLRYMIPVGMPIANARTSIAQNAMAYGLKYLFFIDDDVLLPNFAPLRMLDLMENNPDWDALTGIYTTKRTPAEPLVFGGDPDSSGVYRDWRMGEIFPVWGAGLGCCVIRTDVFHRLDKWAVDDLGVDPDQEFPGAPYFAFIKESSGVASGSVGEDLFFFRNLQKIGAKVMADGAVLCGHIDRKTNKVYQLGLDSLPAKNAVPGFFDDPIGSTVQKDDSYSMDWDAQREAASG